MNIRERIQALFGEAKDLPKTQKCKYCKEQATKRVIWADGRAYVPVCGDHVQHCKDDLKKRNGDMTEIVGVRDIKSDEFESKDGVRRVRDPEFWGLPYGTAILPGMKPKAPDVKRPAKAPGKKPAVVKRAPQKAPARTTGKKVTTPTRANSGRDKQPARARAAKLHDNAVANTTHDQRLRAWGPEDANQSFRRANAGKNDELIQYVSKDELDAVRALAIKRAKTLPPEPSKYDIADNKRLQAEGGVGSSSATDTLRGNVYARSKNSWAVYVNFGGYDEKTGKDKGYVPCLGCGVKMTWHDDRKKSRYPKFEQDKIIVGRYGGQYNPQNIVPMCSGCNNQRGSKLFHESPAFKAAKPKWFTKEWQAKADRMKPAKGLRPENGKGIYGRPVKDMPNAPMPVPPGKVPGGGKKYLGIVLRSKSLTPGEDRIDGTPESGDRVEANLFNFDGRHNDGDNIWAPDYDDVELQVVGTYVSEEVESVWGTYTRESVICDDGSICFVEHDTVRLIARNNDVSQVEKEAVDADKKSLFDLRKVIHGKSQSASVRSGEVPSSVQDGLATGVAEGESYEARDPHEVDQEEKAALRVAYLELKLAGGSNGPATGASNALNKYWTSGKGLARWAGSAHPYTTLRAALVSEGVPEHMASGLAAKYYKKVKGHWPGKNSKKMWDIDLELKGIRRVRTPEGSKKFKLPIGSIIVGKGVLLNNLTLGESQYAGFDQVTHTNGKTFFIGQFPGEDVYVVTDANDNVLHEGKDLEDMFIWANGGGNNTRVVPKPKPKKQPRVKKKTASHGTERLKANFTDTVQNSLAPTYNRSIDRLVTGDRDSALVPNGYLRVKETDNGEWKAEVEYDSPKLANPKQTFPTREEAVEWAAQELALKRERFSVKESGTDERGRRYRNDRPRDYDAFDAYDDGIRGEDWWEENDIAGTDNISRRQRAIADLNELGITVGYRYGNKDDYDVSELHPRGLERYAQALRTHENMYPGFSQLIDGLVYDDSHTFNPPIAYNLPGIVQGGMFSAGQKQQAYLGMTKKFWGAKTDIEGQWNNGSTTNSREHDPNWMINHHTQDSQEYARRRGIPPGEAGMIGTAVHEIGHSIGFIMWNMTSLNRQNNPKQKYPKEQDVEKFVGSYFRADLIELLDSYGMLGKDFPREDSNLGLGTDITWDVRNPDKNLLDKETVAEHLSTYGATNFQEIMAETWAAYQLNANPGDFVRELGALMEDALNMHLEESAAARGE